MAIIDGGSTVGCDGSISGLVPGSHLASASKPLLIGGVPVLKGSGLKAVPASGMYIDELRMSSVVRYEEGRYAAPPKAFTPDDDTLGLYHFDEKSTERYEDASLHQIPLIRVKKDTRLRLNQ
ncbi:hypothetical protein C6500_17510 [Candidatus Poribacteria bacterium]|nr:MAG: hypothetical protein C6500_17510 [Candidatus Poribacteria bacterium]